MLLDLVFVIASIYWMYLDSGLSSADFPRRLNLQVL